MSVDAVALLPPVAGLVGATVEGPWKTGSGPGGAGGLWRGLRDGTLVNLSLPFQTPDADLYEAARRWIGKAPARIWVFPDTAVPDVDTKRAIQTATREGGRWVRAGARQQSVLEDLGFSPDEERAWQREIGSGDPKRMAAGLATLEKRLEGRDPAEIEAVLARFLRRG
jgi:hypothetical protein